jgi:hypothetical protein
MTDNESDFNYSYISNPLQWSALALFGVFLVNIVEQSFTVRLEDPAWLVKITTQLLALAPTALMGSLMLLIAHGLNPSDSLLSTQVSIFRKLTYWASIGFFLIIPLQALSAVRAINMAGSEEQSTLRSLRIAKNAIESATDSDTLKVAVQQIPGIPKDRDLGKLTVPLAQAKQTLIERISPQIKQLENLHELNTKARWKTSILKWSRNSVLALLIGMAFASFTGLARSIIGLLPGRTKPRPQYRHKAQP